MGNIPLQIAKILPSEYFFSNITFHLFCLIYLIQQTKYY
nr:MAG TPA: hypothetical protein [Bacteriophage sp.]